MSFLALSELGYFFHKLIRPYLPDEKKCLPYSLGVGIRLECSKHLFISNWVEGIKYA